MGKRRANDKVVGIRVVQGMHEGQGESRLKEDMMDAITVGMLVFATLMGLSFGYSSGRKNGILAERRRMREENEDESEKVEIDKPSSEFKYIGYRDNHLQVTRNNIGTRKFIVKTLYYMTDDGRREYVHATHEKEAAEWLEHNKTSSTAWKLGGDFPKDFVPETENDVLAKMLNKLIDHSLIGDSGQSDHNVH